MAELIQRCIFQFEAEVGGNHLAAGQNCNVLKHFLAPVAEARSLDANAGKGAAEFVQDQGAESFALDVFGNDDELCAGLGGFLEQRQDFLNAGNLFVRNQNRGVVNNSFHLLGICHHVRSNVAAVKHHAFDNFGIGLRRLGLFHGNYAVGSDFLHCFGNQLADKFIGSGNGRNARDVVRSGNLLGVLLQGFDCCVDCILNALADGHRVCTGGNILHAFADECLCKQCCGRSAVAGHVIRLRSDFLYELRAHVLERVFQFDFLSNRYAVVRNERSTIFFVKNNIASLRAKRNLNGIGKLIYAVQKSLSGIFSIFNLFRHNVIPPNFLFQTVGLFHNCKDVALADDGIIFSVDFDFRAGIFARDNTVALLDVHFYFFAVDDSARASFNYIGDLRLLFCGAGKNDAALCGLFGFFHLDKDSVKQRFNLHNISSLNVYIFLALNVLEC